MSHLRGKSVMATGELTRGQRQSGNELSEITEHSGEIGASHSSALARAEIESAIIIARRFPRNEDQCFGQVMKSCSRLTFAADVCYEYPRGSESVKGLSVYFAKEAARIWGNIRYGCDVVNETDDERTIKCWAWDVQTNTKAEYETTFRKLVQRKNKQTRQTSWVRPDERDLREMTGNIGSRIVRNAILDLLPEDLKRQAEETADRTLHQGVKDNPEEHKKKVILSFGALGIDVEQLELYLGHKLATASPAEIANLRQVYKSIHDGNSTWAEYVRDKEQPQSTGNGNGNGNGGTAGDLANPRKSANPGHSSRKPRGETTKPAETEQPSQEAESAGSDDGGDSYALFDDICARIATCTSLADLASEEAGIKLNASNLSHQQQLELDAMIGTKRRELE